jgi:DNA-binding protein HU-beta
VTKAEIISKVSESTGIDKVIVSVALESFFVEVKDALSSNENLYVRGFGSFIVKTRKAKKARNISLGKTVMVPEHQVPAFKPSKEFIEQVKTKKK